jgi:diacylglycerol kinase family enzyme
VAIKEPIQVVINAGAGANDKDEVVRRLAELYPADDRRCRISVVKSGPDLVELTARAVKENYQTIIAGGGDGTVSSVAGVLVGTDRILGVLPLGTLNHFAKDLHIPIDLEGAMKTIVASHTMQVDVGEVNGRVFLNNSSLGLYPKIVREREKQQRLGWGKWPAFVWAAVSVLRRYPLLDVRLSVDEAEFARRTPFVFVGNNEYEMESFNIGARPCLDKGELSLYITHRTGRLGLMRLALRALFGGLRKESDFTAMCTKEVWIKTRHRRLRVALDGEITVVEPPLHYRVRPGALRVIAPAPAHESGKQIEE